MTRQLLVCYTFKHLPSDLCIGDASEPGADHGFHELVEAHRVLLAHVAVSGSSWGREIYRSWNITLNKVSKFYLKPFRVCGNILSFLVLKRKVMFLRGEEEGRG